MISSRAHRQHSLLLTIVALVWLALYLAHFRLIWLYAVDVPYWDEWDVIKMLHTQSGESWFPFNWLFHFHNKHRFATVNAMILVLYALNGWNVAAHQIINFLIFGGLLLFIVRFAKSTVPSLPCWVMLGFTLFLLSPVNYENHFRAYQTNVHFALLFFLGAVYFLFTDDLSDTRGRDAAQQHAPSVQDGKRLLCGVILAIMAIYSNACGVASCGVMIVGFVPFKWRRLRDFSGSDSQVAARREKLQLVWVVVPIVLALSAWFIGYSSARAGSFPASPRDVMYWKYFFNVLALGFGFMQISTRWGLICMALVAAPLLALGWRMRQGATPRGLCLASGNALAVVTATLGIFSILLLISMGRAGIGVEQSKSPRYSEFGMLLIPLSALLWSLAFQERVRLRNAVLALLWMFYAFSFAGTRQQLYYYRWEHDRRINDMAGVRHYYEKGGPANFPALFPRPMESHLEAAKALNLSFYRTMRQRPK
jgi:hypothetical protein